jgi:hypothetical protein
VSERKTVCDCNPASGWKPCARCPNRTRADMTTGEAEAFRAGRAEGYDEAIGALGVRIVELEAEAQRLREHVETEKAMTWIVRDEARAEGFAAAREAAAAVCEARAEARHSEAYGATSEGDRDASFGAAGEAEECAAAIRALQPKEPG